MSVDLKGRWMHDGACVDRPDLPWTADPISLRPVQVRAMGRVCGACLVRNHCAAYAIEAEVTGGFWAGQDRISLAPRRISTAGTPVQPALPGIGLVAPTGRGRVA